MKKLTVLLLGFGLTLAAPAQTASTGSSQTKTQATQTRPTEKPWCDPSREVIVDILRHDLDYRRSTLWNVFSWCSTLLIAIAGGATALQMRHANSLNTTQKLIASLAVSILVAYGFGWLTHNVNREWEIRDCLNDHLIGVKDEPIEDKFWRKSPTAGGERVAVLFLGSAALLAIWLPFRKNAATGASRNRQDS